MKIKVRMFIGDTYMEFENLDVEMQAEYKKKHTRVYANQVVSKVIEMMNQGKTEKEIRKYLLMDEML